MASARASAVSAGFGGSAIRSSRITMVVTWALSARPLPVTAAFTSLGVCRATGSWRRAAHSTATAPACAVPMTVRTLCWLNTRSTATASGRYSASQESISTSSASSRAARSSPASVRMTPAATRPGGRPGVPSTMPSPHRVSPGSTPSTRIAAPSRPVISPANTCSVATLPAPTPWRGEDVRRVAARIGLRPGPEPRGSRAAMRERPSAELLHHVIRHGVVRVDILHVVGVLQRVDQPEYPFGLLLVQLDFYRWQCSGLRVVKLDRGLLRRGAHGHQVSGLADHLVRLAEVVDLCRSGILQVAEHVVLGHPARFRHDHDALAVEHIGHRAGVGHGTAVAGQRRPDVGGRPVPVVGEALHEHRDPPRGVALVGDRLVGGPAGFEATAPADGPVDVVAGDRIPLGLLHRIVERGVPGQVSAAGPGRDLNILDQLGEQLAAPGVDDRLLVLGRGPLRMAAHERSLPMSTKSLCTRGSPVSSGWNAVASAGPCRTATILPVADSVPRISTCAPVCSTQGARMKTARNAGPGTPASAMSLSNESTWRPNALWRTVMSIPPNVCCPFIPSSSRSASMIMPAHDPNAGIPALIRFRSGSIRSKITASFHIVVDSPPGMTSPSTASSSSGRRTGTADAPTTASAARCSDTSPCSASTPTTGSAGVAGMAILLGARVSLERSEVR